MKRITQLLKLVAFSGILFTGSCLPDNFWAGVWGTTVIDGTIGAVRDFLLAPFLQ